MAAFSEVDIENPAFDENDYDDNTEKNLCNRRKRKSVSKYDNRKI